MRYRLPSPPPECDTYAEARAWDRDQLHHAHLADPPGWDEYALEDER